MTSEGIMQRIIKSIEAQLSEVKEDFESNFFDKNNDKPVISELKHRLASVLHDNKVEDILPKVKEDIENLKNELEDKNVSDAPKSMWLSIKIPYEYLNEKIKDSYVLVPENGQWQLFYVDKALRINQMNQQEEFLTFPTVVLDPVKMILEYAELDPLDVDVSFALFPYLNDKVIRELSKIVSQYSQSIEAKMKRIELNLDSLIIETGLMQDSEKSNVARETIASYQTQLAKLTSKYKDSILKLSGQGNDFSGIKMLAQGLLEIGLFAYLTKDGAGTLGLGSELDEMRVVDLPLGSSNFFGK